MSWSLWQHLAHGGEPRDWWPGEAPRVLQVRGPTTALPGHCLYELLVPLGRDFTRRSAGQSQRTPWLSQG